MSIINSTIIYYLRSRLLLLFSLYVQFIIKLMDIFLLSDKLVLDAGQSYGVAEGVLWHGGL